MVSIVRATCGPDLLSQQSAEEMVITRPDTINLLPQPEHNGSPPFMKTMQNFYIIESFREKLKLRRSSLMFMSWAGSYTGEWRLGTHHSDHSGVFESPGL